MLDDSLLDTPEALAEADHRALLRGAAEAGARVRTAARYAAEAGVHDLQPDGRPRAILIAGPGAAATCVADLLGTLAGAACPVIRLTPTGVAPPQAPCAGNSPAGRAPWTFSSSPPPTAASPASPSSPNRPTAAAARSPPWPPPTPRSPKRPAPPTDCSCRSRPHRTNRTREYRTRPPPPESSGPS